MTEKTVHELKILPEYFEAVKNKSKKFEVRKNDRDFKVGDTIMLLEWNGEYTGRFLIAQITYILNDKKYCAKDMVIMSIELV